MCHKYNFYIKLAFLNLQYCSLLQISKKRRSCHEIRIICTQTSDHIDNHLLHTNFHVNTVPNSKQIIQPNQTMYVYLMKYEKVEPSTVETKFVYVDFVSI